MGLRFPDHSTYVQFAEYLANLSRSILISEAAKAPKISVKIDTTYVTEADRYVEARLREEIRKKFPHHGIIGEEFPDENREADFVWILDPIDGTAAFIAGIPVYGTLIALACEGCPFIGIIDHPVTNDRWVGISNRSALKNGAPIVTRSCTDITKAYATCSNPDFMSESQLRRFKKLRDTVSYVQYGASCFAYGALASGRSDFAIDADLQMYDIYACAAVVQGAGGVVTDWTGRRLSFDMDGTVISAGDKTQLNRVLALLNSKKGTN